MSNPSYLPSEIDTLFYEIYGYYPTKQGKAFEMLVGAVTKILNKDKTIVIDERKRGEYDNNIYQVDCSVYEEKGSIMIEAKDHSLSGKKVSRPEIDKLAGSLLDLRFGSAEFFTSTGYKKDAINKSLGSFLNPQGKKIYLNLLKIPQEADFQGRLESVNVKIRLLSMDVNNVKITPEISPEDMGKFEEKKVPMNFKTVADFEHSHSTFRYTSKVFDEMDNTIGHFNFTKPLTEKLVPNDQNIATGIWDIDDFDVSINNTKLKLSRIKYEIPFIEGKVEFTIEAKGKSVLLVISEENHINKTITDHQLRGITFANNGEVHFDGRNP